MRLSHTARAATVVVALLTAFVAGCDEDDGPTSIPPSDSPSAPESSEPTEPTTTATPTETGPVEPTLPTDAEEESKAGVKAFVTYYWDVINYATKTGDVRVAASIGPAVVRRMRGRDHRIERVYGAVVKSSAGLTASFGSSPSDHRAAQWAVVAHTRVGAQRAVGAGKLNRTYPAGRANVADWRRPSRWGVERHHTGGAVMRASIAAIAALLMVATLACVSLTDEVDVDPGTGHSASPRSKITGDRRRPHRPVGLGVYHSEPACAGSAPAN